MIYSIVAIIGVASFIFGLLIFLRDWKLDSNLEKKYTSFNRELSKSGEFLYSQGKKNPFIIIETGKKYEIIRTLIKKLAIRIRRGESPQIIYIIGKDTIEEKEAFLIQNVIANEWNKIEILDFNFIEAMINYFAYKYTHNKRNIAESVKLLLREEFESCPQREHITKLDNPDFEDKVVINPPPQKKPILHDIILPLVLDQNKKVREKNLPEKESLKAKLMEIIYELCRCNCGILFIGELPVSEYARSLMQRIHKHEYFLLSSRGNQTFVLDNVKEKFFEILRYQIRYELSSFEGTYVFRDRSRRSLPYKYTLLKKSSTAGRIRQRYPTTF